MDDELWAWILPLLPASPQRPPGPHPVDDRWCRQGGLFALCTATGWRQLHLQ